MGLVELHTGFSWFVVIGTGLAGLWALGAHWERRLRIGALWWFTIAAQSTVFVQAALGAGMVAGLGIEAPGFHLFYGFLAIIAVALVYAYRAQAQYVYLLYGLGGLFIMGLGIRAMVLA